MMRKGFSGLSGLVRGHIGYELLSGDVFIFINRRRDRIKLLMWVKTGFALYYKQLKTGSFERVEEGGEVRLARVAPKARLARASLRSPLVFPGKADSPFWSVL